MKNHRWLSVAEYAMLVGSGVGSVVTVASQQAIYSVAPLSALLVLNLLNHRRLEHAAQETTEAAVSQLDQKVTTTLTSLQQQVHALPSPLHLATLRKDLQAKNQSVFQELFQQIQQLQKEFTDADWRSLSQGIATLQEHYSSLESSVIGVRESLSRLNASHQTTKITDELNQLKADVATLQTALQQIDKDPKINHYRVLQDQITHLNKRLNKLPAPFDATTLRQDMAELVKIVGEMPSRRDISRLEMNVDQLAQRHEEVEGAILPLKVVTNILRKKVDMVSNRLGGLETIIDPETTAFLRSSLVDELQATVNSLEQRVRQLPHASDLNQLRTELQEMVSAHLGQFQTQLNTIQQHTYALDQQHRALRDWIHRLPQLLDTSALQNEVKHLANRVEWAETHLTTLQSQAAATPSYELVFEVAGRQVTAGEGQTLDRTIAHRPLADPPEMGSSSTAVAQSANPSGLSRRLLEQALQDSDGRLVVVYPFPSPEILDGAMMQHFRAFLARRGCLDLGWGQLDKSSNRQARSIDHRRSIYQQHHEFLFSLLNQLTELKKQFPDQVRFRVLGTDEYFLVCDRAYAILGSPSLQTTSVIFPEAMVGLKITDAAVIQTLVERFDNPMLDEQDTTAYFNRAEARYELGNRQGAIADYTTILKINPLDDITLNNRALVYYDLAQHQQALADLDAAIAQNPYNFIAYTNRGYLRSEQGNKLGAIEDFTAALKLNPDWTIAYFYRGLARTRMQNKLGAIQDYSEVIRLNPQDASAYFYRGLACAKVGHRMEAVRDLRQASQLFAEQGDTANYQQSNNALKKLQKMMVIAGSGKPLVSNGA